MQSMTEMSLLAVQHQKVKKKVDKKRYNAVAVSHIACHCHLLCPWTSPTTDTYMNNTNMTLA